MITSRKVQEKECVQLFYDTLWTGNGSEKIRTSSTIFWSVLWQLLPHLFYIITLHKVRMSIKFFNVLNYSFLKVVTLNPSWVQVEHSLFLIKYDVCGAMFYGIFSFSWCLLSPFWIFWSKSATSCILSFSNEKTPRNKQHIVYCFLTIEKFPNVIRLILRA